MLKNKLKNYYSSYGIIVILVLEVLFLLSFVRKLLYSS